MSLRKPKPAAVAPYRGPGASGAPGDTDPYAVLSMHQPWASLLVHGIKRIEGRSWPTQHRGRLWIHATSQQPSATDTQELEAFYTEVHATESRLPIFPQSYPVSALLGCVEVVDCLPAEDVKAWPDLPAGLQLEVGSPFAWLCQAPRRLVVPQRMPGAPRIWTLPKAKLDPLSRGLKEPPGVIPFCWADMPPRIGPASSSAGASSTAKPKSQQQQQQQQEARAAGQIGAPQEEQASSIAAVAPSIAAMAPSPPSQSAGTSSSLVAEQQEADGDVHCHPAPGRSELPAKRPHTAGEPVANQ